MKNRRARSLATGARLAGAALGLSPVASAATTDAVPDDPTSHASAIFADVGTGPALGFWIGGGALAMAGGAIAVGTTVRRHRHTPRI